MEAPGRADREHPATSSEALYLGLMSGTSLDGVDAVLARISNGRTQLLGHDHLPYDPAWRARLLDLHEPAQDELDTAVCLANLLTRHYAEAVTALLGRAGYSADRIAAIGCHGQTVRHRPERGYTLQLVNGALLAELTGITSIVDFRSRDIAAGGQGAPLVPAFHAAAFSHPERHRVIVNIGGIANLTDLPARGAVSGFDCGPGNMLMDAWCYAHTGQAFDVDGRLAGRGKVLPALLDRFLADAYFHLPPPKSTGRDHFSWHWLAEKLSPADATEDVQATLLKLTVTSIHDAVIRHCPGVEEVFLCGGGAKNRALVDGLRHAFAAEGIPVGLTDILGIPVDQVEAAAFAWLAKRCLDGKPGNLPAVTGAAGPRVLGAIYPA